MGDERLNLWNQLRRHGNEGLVLGGQGGRNLLRLFFFALLIVADGQFADWFQGRSRTAAPYGNPPSLSLPI